MDWTCMAPILLYCEHILLWVVSRQLWEILLHNWLIVILLLTKESGHDETSWYDF